MVNRREGNASEHWRISRMNETQPEENAQQLTRIVHPTEELPPPLRAIRRSIQLLSVSFFLNIFAPFLSIQNFAISVSSPLLYPG
jgi:hypothetical protein